MNASSKSIDVWHISQRGSCLMDPALSCFLCLLCQCLPATSCAFSVSRLLSATEMSLWAERPALLCPRSCFGMVPWWLRGQEKEVENDISAWLFLCCSFQNPHSTHKHPQTPTTSRARQKKCFTCGLFRVPRKVSDTGFSNFTLNSFHERIKRNISFVLKCIKYTGLYSKKKPNTQYFCVIVWLFPRQLHSLKILLTGKWKLNMQHARSPDCSMTTVGQPWRECIKLVLFWCSSHPRTLAFSLHPLSNNGSSVAVAGPVGRAVHFTLWLLFTWKRSMRSGSSHGDQTATLKCTNVAYGSSAYQLGRFSLYKQTRQEQTSNFPVSDSYHILTTWATA